MVETQLRLPKIREVIVKELGEVLTPLSYKIKNKQGEIIFKKNTNYGYVELQFYFYDHFPLNYQVQFVFYIFIEKIVRTLEVFSKNFGKAFYLTPQVKFTEGDFVPELKTAQAKYRYGYKNILKTENDLVGMISKYKGIILEKLLKIEMEFDNNERASIFLENCRELIIANCDFGMIATDLILHNQLRKDSYPSTLNFYLEKLNEIVPQKGFAARSTIETIGELDKFLKTEP